MKFVRSRILRLIAILAYVCAFAALPVYWPVSGAGAMQGCGCLMCRTLGPGHCTCCEMDKCTCHISTGSDVAVPALALERAVLPAFEVGCLLTPSVLLSPESPHAAPAPSLSVPTPPPKSGIAS